MNYSKLFIDNCPIIYFDKNETYMPVDFKDILNISNINPNNLNKVDIIYLYDEDKYYNKIGKQILCKTNGYTNIDGEKCIDLIYIITYLWSGDNILNEHPFDKSIIIIRLDENNNMTKIYYNNELEWYDKKDITFENNKPVLYSSLKTHKLYYNKLNNNNIKWEPTEFIIYDNNNINLFDINNKKIDEDLSYYLYDKNIGNETFNQQMPLSINFNIQNMEGFYNYNGDIFNIFTKHDIMSFKFLKKVLLILFLLISLLMIYFDVKKYKINVFNIIYIVIYIYLLINSYINLSIS